MRLKPLSLLPVLTLVASVFAQQPAAAHFDGSSWWNHVKVLADDSMEGRETGSRGERKAQEYVVKKFSDAGLQPAGSKGFYQPVKFVSRRVVPGRSSVALVRGGNVEPLAVPDDAAFSASVDMPPQTIEAPLVFVGYGLQIPEQNYDDFAGLDLKGKIIVYFSGSPENIPSALSAHYQSPRERWNAVRKTGAIGMIRLLNPASMDLPWSRIAASTLRQHMTLADPEFDETAGEKVSMYFNPASAAKLFAASGHSYDQIVQAGGKREPLPRFPLNLSLRAHADLEKRPVESANVVAKLPGSDPALRNEYVVFSAHLDHLGIGQPINGDKIYNGAMDNASGVALLLDMAESLKKSEQKLRRSILFVVVTGEEHGLLGSKYFAARPTIDPKSIVADINADMFLPIVPLKIVEVLGLEESDLGDDVRQIAQARGLRVEPDPEPLRNTFIRSDQYSFIRQGVPAVFLNVGYEKGSPEQKIFKQWLTEHYHAPSDDTKQSVNLQTAAQMEEIYRELLIEVANAGARPQWKPSSFFRRFAAP